MTPSAPERSVVARVATEQLQPRVSESHGCLRRELRNIRCAIVASAHADLFVAFCAWI